MKQLYKFFWDCGRQGSLKGVFTATHEEVAAAIGKHIYFGEVLGKHSDISGTLESKDIRFLTDDQEFIKQATEYGLIPTGFDPIQRLKENEE